MTAPQPEDSNAIAPRAAVEAVLDWWSEAGIDCAFSDAAQNWLEDTAPAAGAAAIPPAPIPRPTASPVRSAIERALEPAPHHPIAGGDRGAWPQSLPHFREWWMSEPSLAEGTLDRRISPTGVAGAKLMAIIPQPLSGDRESLAEGPPGRFLAAVLAACGIAAHETYLASALPAPAALPDWDALARAGMGEVVRHHVALAAPSRVLLFGRSTALLLGLDPADTRTPFAIGAIPTLAVPELSELARSPTMRQRFWQSWLDWTR